MASGDVRQASFRTKNNHRFWDFCASVQADTYTHTLNRRGKRSEARVKKKKLPKEPDYPPESRIMLLLQR